MRIDGGNGRGRCARRARRVAGLAALCGLLAACGDHAAPPAPLAQPLAGGHGQYGTVIAIRPIAATAARHPVLAALGSRSANAAAASEFVLRDDIGRTVSVVQDSRAGLRVGDAVQLIGQGHTRLVRWPGAATGA